MGKAIKVVTPSNTELTDQQKRDYVPIFLPGGAEGRRQITERDMSEAALLLPSGSSMQEDKTFLYIKHTRSGRHRTMARIHFTKYAPRARLVKEANTPNTFTSSNTPLSKHAGSEPSTNSPQSRCEAYDQTVVSRSCTHR